MFFFDVVMEDTPLPPSFRGFPEACTAFHEQLQQLFQRGPIDPVVILRHCWIEYSEELSGQRFLKAKIFFSEIRSIARTTGCLTTTGALPEHPVVDSLLLELCLAAAVDAFRAEHDDAPSTS